MTRAKQCFLIVCTTLLLPLASCAAPHKAYSRTITPDSVALLRMAMQVQPYRIKGQQMNLNSIPGKTLDGYPIVRIGSLKGRAFSQHLAQAIVNAFAYPGPEGKCILDPGVAYQFRGTGEIVDVLVCFHCGDMEVIERSVSGKIINVAHTRLTQASFGTLARSAQLSFPSNAELKAVSYKTLR